MIYKVMQWRHGWFHSLTTACTYTPGETHKIGEGLKDVTYPFFAFADFDYACAFLNSWGPNCFIAEIENHSEIIDPKKYQMFWYSMGLKLLPEGTVFVESFQLPRAIKGYAFMPTGQHEFTNPRFLSHVALTIMEK